MYSWWRFPYFWRSHEPWFFFRSLQDHRNESVFSSEWFTESDKLNYIEKTLNETLYKKYELLTLLRRSIKCEKGVSILFCCQNLRCLKWNTLKGHTMEQKTIFAWRILGKWENRWLSEFCGGAKRKTVSWNW